MQKKVLDHQEIEWQFDAADLGSVEGRLEESLSPDDLRVVPGATRQLTDTYYDTEDWRFYRAGYALRVRREGENVEATMKSLTPPEDGGLKRRREISEPLKSGGLKTLTTARGPVGERLRLLAGTRDLRPLFEVRTRRKTFELRSGGQKGSIHRREGAAVLAEVALDESEFLGGGRGANLSRVEVEVSDGAAGSYDEVAGFVDRIRGALELVPTETSKFETGISASGLSPEGAPELGSTMIDATLSAGEVAFAVLRRHFATMLDNELGVRLGEDPEDLHDMRVATRRLRATLKLYADYLPRRAGRLDLRWVASSLGEVRDLDVHLERLTRGGSGDGESLEEIIAALQERRREARRRMLEVLDSSRYERLLSDFAGMLRRGPEPTASILEVAPDLVRRRHKKVRKAAHGLGEDSPPEDFHDLRKKGRRLRYALEPLQGIYGKPAKRMVEVLKELQDDLGDHQDLVVAAARLREEGVSANLPPQTVFSMGSMAGRYAVEAAEIRAVVPGSRPLRALSKGKKWKSLRKVMKKRANEKIGG